MAAVKRSRVKIGLDCEDMLIDLLRHGEPVGGRAYRGNRIDDPLSELGWQQMWQALPAKLSQPMQGEVEAFYRDPVNCRPAGAEPLDEFVTRTTRCFEQLLRSDQVDHALVVTHAGVIRAVVSHVLEMPPAAMYRIKIENARITRIRSGQRGLQVEKLNYAWKQVC